MGRNFLSSRIEGWGLERYIGVILGLYSDYIGCILELYYIRQGLELRSVKCRVGCLSVWGLGLWV